MFAQVTYVEQGNSVPVLQDPPAAEEAMGAASNGGSKAMRIDADETQLKSIEHSLFRLRSLGNDSRP